MNRRNLAKCVAAQMSMLLLLQAASAGAAGVDEECVGEAPSDYDEQLQRDFVLNYVALASTLSPIHGAIPHEPGHGAIGIDLAFIPPLSCERRFALNASKTQDPNKAPVLPRPRLTFAFPEMGGVVPYAGIAFVPPITLDDTRTMIVSGEAGAGVRVWRGLELGGRLHATLHRTTGELATPLDPGDSQAQDFYQASTMGIDIIGSWRFASVTSFLSAGLTDVSTYFWVGDDGVVVSNLHPYLGPVFSLGAEGLIVERLRWGVEFYAAPGGHRQADDDFSTRSGFGTYGRLYTARARLAFEL